MKILGVTVEFYRALAFMFFAGGAIVHIDGSIRFSWVNLYDADYRLSIMPRHVRTIGCCDNTCYREETGQSIGVYYFVIA